MNVPECGVGLLGHPPPAVAVGVQVVHHLPHVGVHVPAAGEISYAIKESCLAMQMSFAYLSRLEASSPALQSPLMTLPRLEKGMGMPISKEKVGTRSTWSTEVELWSLKLSLKQIILYWMV